MTFERQGRTLGAPREFKKHGGNVIEFGEAWALPRCVVDSLSTSVCRYVSRYHGPYGHVVVTSSLQYRDCLGPSTDLVSGA